MFKWLRKKALSLYASVVLEKKPPDFIARGWAVGMFVGCAVPFGFQLVISVPLAFCLKGSRIGATVGTFITNPFTIFFIYPVQCWVADRLFLAGGLSYSKLAGTEWSFEAVAELGSETLRAFFLGGILFAVILTPITYFTVLHLVRGYRRQMEKRKARHSAACPVGAERRLVQGARDANSRRG